jgi:hypothetical protein
MNTMKKLGNWIKENVLLTFVYITVGVFVLMIIFYFCNFHEGFSDKDSSWSNFGSYFASITGLMAFAGVLYTAWQSEKRAEKVKEESIKREERDLFFKLLDLHQEKLSSIIYIDQDTKKVHSGFDAIGKYVDILNSSLCDYAINYYIVKYSHPLQTMITESEEKDYIVYIKNRCKIICNENKIGDDSIFNFENVDFEKIQRFIKKNIQKTYFYKLYNLNEYKINSMEEIFNTLNKSENKDGIYLGIKLVGNIINEQFGHILGQYFRNMYYVLDTCKNFKNDNEYYFKLYRAQLSRTEIVLCLLNAISDKSSPKFVKLLNDNNILDDLYYRDFVFIKFDEKYNGYELQFVKDMLNLYLEEHKESN